MKKQKSLSIKYKFIIFFLCAVFIPITVISSVSYKLSSKIIQDKFTISNLTNIKQIGYNIDFVLNDVHQLSLNIIKDQTIYNFLRDASDPSFILDAHTRLSLEQWLYYLEDSNKYIDSIFIKSRNGAILYTKGIEYPAVMDIDPNIQEQVEKLKGGYLWHANEQKNNDSLETPVISLTRSLNDINSTINNLGTLEINIKESKLSEIYRNNLTNSGEEYFLVDSNNRIISCTDKKLLYQPMVSTVFQQITGSPAKLGYFTDSINKNNILITYYKLDNTNWFLVNYVQLSDLFKEIRVVRTQLLLSISISFFIFFLLTILFLNRFLKPLKELRSVMREFQNGNFDVRVNVKGGDEIALVGNSFNQMSDKLKELMNQVYLGKIKQKEAELSILQSQINPHFLYNTLDTIYWIARMENAMQTSKLIQALSNLFRLSLNNGQEFTTVANELQHLKSYILIQEKRYEGMIKFSIDVDEETLNCQVIKLILQPLVENSIYHGIEPKGEDGEIHVNIYRENDLLIYVVSDNGAGTDASEIQKVLAIPHDKKVNFGFALKNVNDRIKLYYGDAYGIEFESAPGIGTTVTVKQPFMKGSDIHD